MVISKPQPFDGTHGATAKAFIGQIGLHAITYPKDYTATWSQPYLDKIFNKVPVVFDDFLNDFRSSFLITTTSTVPSMPAPLVGPTPTYEHQHGLKENIQLAVVMRNIEFDCLHSLQALALKAVWKEKLSQ
ncbi:uncharacterized protein VP01_6940g1 [Puccinia sorghi]|uniref:Uncharacterized protein n=1 Tax=Puccinia sorghi TaxID=27349 RepID=A0A0L6UE10_9BASI|nr:uncharacterized protein VP01_6940g1 [Puccinia sorghi]